MPSLDSEVVLVGAGPVGLIISLNLAKQGISVTLLETFSEIIQSPRAMAYGPAAVVELERSGIAQECRDIGMDSTDYDFVMRWITIDNKPVASIESSLWPQKYPPVRCGQHLVAKIILKHLSEYKNAKVLWNHKCVSVEQDAESVTAVCETNDGETVRVTGKYLVGADGARSSVRKAIGCSFDGFTYDKMVVATNVYYPFTENGFHRGQFIIHPEHFCMVTLPLVCIDMQCAKVQPDGMFRVSYGEDSKLSFEEARANLENKYNAIFPGPKPVTGKYDLKMFSPYKLHQRSSSSFRVERVLLAGDAAHACNPFGGMGLTGGLCDAGGLSDCLIGVLRKGCGDDVLDKYAEIRKKIFLEVRRHNLVHD
jgi:2-polyprenyl-6-methoxyphenol hydroxylase-like FAD-dependent oxidoreductase